MSEEEDYDYLDTKDPEEIEIPIESLDNEYLIDRCLLDDFTKDSRWEACQELAYRCNKAMKGGLGTEGRKKLRQSIIEEVDIKNELSEQTVEIPCADPTLKPKKFRVPLQKTMMFDAGFDTDKYVEEHKKTPFGFCNLALYGLEWGFMEEVNEMPFQSRKHADMIKNSEKLIFDDCEIYRTAPTKQMIENIYDNMSDKEQALILGDDPSDPNVRVGFKNLREALKNKVEEKIEKRILKEKIITTSQPQKDIWFEKCEFIDMNPFINDKTKYKYCTEANLNDQQNFIIKKKEIKSEAINTDTWDKLKGLKMETVWETTKDEYKEEILDKTDKRLGMGLYHTYDDFNDYSKKERDAILGTYQEYNHDKLIDITKNMPPKIIYGDSGRLDCYHHHYQYVSHPTQAYTEQLKLEAAYEFGDISKEKYMEMIEELKTNKDLMGVRMDEPHRTPEEYKKLYKKQTEYLPIRYRIWGSQSYLNKIFHYGNYYYPLHRVAHLGGIGSHEIFDTIEESIDNDDYIGMEEGKIYDIKTLEMIKNLPEAINADKLIECLRPLAEKNAKEYIEDDTIEYVRNRDWNIRYEMIMDTMNMEYYDIEDYYSAVSVTDDVDLVDIPENEDYRLIKIAEGGNYEYEDIWEDVEPHEYMEYFKREYPDITEEQVYYIFERDLGSPSPFSFDIYVTVNYVIGMKFDELVEKVKKYMKDRNLGVDSLIWAKLQNIAYIYDYNINI